MYDKDLDDKLKKFIADSEKEPVEVDPEDMFEEEGEIPGEPEDVSEDASGTENASDAGGASFGGNESGESAGEDAGASGEGSVQKPGADDEQETEGQRKLALAAVICGIISISSFIFIPSAALFGGLAITLGLFSRGSRRRMRKGNARIGVRLGIAGILVSIVVSIGSFLYVMNLYGGFAGLMEAYENTFSQMYEQMYGEEYDPYGY